MKDTDYGSIEVLNHTQKGVKACGDDFSYCNTIKMKFGTCINGYCREKWDYKEESPHFTLKFSKEDYENFINKNQFVKDTDDNYLLYLQGNEGESDYKGLNTIQRKLVKDQNLKDLVGNKNLAELDIEKNLGEKNIEKNLEEKDNGKNSENKDSTKPNIV